MASGQGKGRTRRALTHNGEVSGSLTNRAYRAIKDEILNIRLKPGVPVPTERFVRDLKLSRTPLREAIQRLAGEGFLDIRPRMGTFVSYLDVNEIQERYQVRAVLEGAAARLAATQADRHALQTLQQELRSYPTEGQIDVEAISESGQKLHGLIVASCGNRVLRETIVSLQDHFVRFRRLSLKIPEKVLSSHREHLSILQALQDGDGANAEQLVRQHFDHAAAYLLDSLLNRRIGLEDSRLKISPVV